VNAWLQQAALWTWQNSLAGAALAAAVLGMRRVFRGKIAARWLFLAGWLVMLRLFLPAPLPHSWAWDRAWAGAAPRVDNAGASAPAETGNVIADGAAPSLAQLREEIANARASLDNLRASGFGPIHPNVLSAREQTPAEMPVPRMESDAPGIDWLAITAWIWCGGALCFALAIFVRHRRFMRRLTRTAKPVALRWAGLLEECATAVKLRRVPLLLTVPGGGTPFLCGLFRPRIILPEETLASLTHAEARHVLLHEMLHIARRDLFANWLLAALRAWHWFNPFIHGAGRRLLADRELLRDAQAIALLRDPAQRSAYGHTLLKLALPLSAPAPSPGVVPLLHSEKELQRRLTMIQSSVRHRRFATCATAVALAAISAPIFTTARGQVKTEVEKSAAPPPAAEKKVFEVTEAPLPKSDSAGPTLPPAASESSTVEIDQLTGQSSVLKELKGDQLVAGALALGGEENSTLAKVYPEYQAELATLGSLTKSGFGPKHPKTLGLRESIRLKHQQLESAAETYRQSLLFRIAAAKAGSAEGVSDSTTKAESPAAETDPKAAASETKKPLPAPLQNLYDTAAALRKKGQNDEAAAIENAIKELAAEKSVKEKVKHPKADPKFDYYRRFKQAIGESVELDQLRAEMATIKAALKELEARSHNESLDKLLKLKQTKSFGQRYNKSPDELLKEAMKRDNEKLFRKKDPGATDAEGTGDAVEKPARKSSDEKQADPDGADVKKVEQLLKDSADQLKSAIAKVHAEPAKKTEKTGENLPWAVAVPGKTGLVYSPHSPEHAIVDVNGFKKGDKVKCPYTDNFFKVP
jgi:beta-lactamase regulating signal transducer with metallopeptidase domain